MAKIAKPIKRPSRNSGFNGRREVAPHLIVTRKGRNSSALLVAAAPVEFMELRPSMCRWPIGDPQHFETFRFCGSVCPFEAAYCKKHDAMAHASRRPQTPRRTKFQMRSLAVCRTRSPLDR